jgi:hypothetical protein
MSEVFGFLKSSCARCGANRGLYKINNNDWLCLECLKEGEYKASWTDIKTKISENYDFRKDDHNVIYEKLMTEADDILNYKILLDKGEITQEEYDEKAKHFFK